MKTLKELRDILTQAFETKSHIDVRTLAEETGISFEVIKELIVASYSKATGFSLDLWERRVKMAIHSNGKFAGVYEVGEIFPDKVWTRVSYSDYKNKYLNSNKRDYDPATKTIEVLI